MSTFGNTLFGGSRFIRWALSPFVLIFAISMPLIIEEWTLSRAALMAGIEFMCLSLLAGLWLPAKIGNWAFRILAGSVFLAYASYLIYELFLSGAPFRLSGRRGEASPRNALLGFVIIGLPSLWFALKGRFSLRAEPSPEQLAAERQALEERLLRPDWAFYERHLQRPAPKALRELYASRALLTADVIEYPGENGISTFEPLDEQGLLDASEEPGTDVVPIATSDCGDPIYLRPGPSEPDTLYITCHDGGDTEVFAESVAAMLEKLRQANRCDPVPTCL